MNTEVTDPKEWPAVVINYTNWKGMTHTRIITPIRFFFGSTEYHPTPQYLLLARDEEIEEDRVFAVQHIHEWGVTSND